jgi:hypothetical protein
LPPGFGRSTLPALHAVSGYLYACARHCGKIRVSASTAPVSRQWDPDQDLRHPGLGTENCSRLFANSSLGSANFSLCFRKTKLGSANYSLGSGTSGLGSANPGLNP